MFSQVTVNIMNFILLAKLFVVTGSTIATSLLWVSYALPSVFFGSIGAATVDLINRRKILMITNLLQALVVFAYIFTYKDTFFLLYAVVLIYSFLNQFYVPAESSTLPSVVSKTHLPQANSMFLLTQQVALVVGFGLAGIIQKFLGFEGSLILCSVLLFISFISVSFLPDLRPRRKIPNNFEDLMRTFFNHIIEGYRFIKEKKSVLYPLGLLLMIQVALAIVITNLPVIAEQILNVNVDYAGLLVVVPAGVGATLGSILVTRFLKIGWRKKRIIDIGLLILGLSALGIVFGITVTAPVFIALVGLGFVFINIPTFTYLQEVTPLWLRGRVFGNLWFVITIVTIFPVMFSGVISEFFGVKTLLTILSLGVIFILSYSYKKGQRLIEENFNKNE